MVYNPCVKPGILEIYCGPMRSGKTLHLIHRLDQLTYQHKFTQNEFPNFIVLKPSLDTRTQHLASRNGTHYPCQLVASEHPEQILSLIKKYHEVIAFDEAQFFSSGIESIVEQLLREKKNVVAAGLELDFRGEPFGRMHYLLAMAHIVHKLTAVCEYPKCGAMASRTQRLVNGKPAPYDAPLIVIGDAAEGYEPRCIRHHEVPGKPGPFPRE